jgi:transposase InsO family protein
VALTCSSHRRLAAENLFLRKQLAFYIERKVRPRRLNDATRIALVVLARAIDWRQLLVVVRPGTLVRWHRQGFRLFWRWPVSPRPSSSPHSWSTFVRNHARETLACDFFVAVTATFRLVYVFVVLEIGTRRILHWNVTEHSTAVWTAQQFRSFVTGDEPYRFVVHDRDAVFAAAVDDALRSMNLRVLKTPARVPQANAFCERLIGTARRECLDHLIPLNEPHLRKILAEWVPHYNRGRPHASLGPGIPEASGLTVSRTVDQLPHGHRVVTKPILAGLHHEYRLEPIAA